MTSLVSFAEILAARERTRGTVVRSPLLRLEASRLRAAGVTLSRNAPAFYLKNEAAQPIGSFKLRGAYNHVASLKERDPEGFRRGVITFSSGNHAQGVAFAARALGTRAVIVMPDNAPTVKRRATEALGAEIVTVGPASTERKLRAESLVAQYGYAMVPPYDDADIIAGQATCGLEIVEQLAEADGAASEGQPTGRAGSTLILCPVSGGGLLSGVASGVHLASAAAGRMAPAVWGCEPELAGDARESFYRKTLVEWAASLTTRTLADGLRTQSLGERNFAHILRYVQGIVTVSENEIRSATKLYLSATDIVAEPSGAVTLAAALYQHGSLPATDRVVVIVSGGNLDPALRDALRREPLAGTEGN